MGCKSPHSERIFLTPQHLRDAFEAFKLDVKEQGKEWERIQYVGRDGERRTDPTKVPLTFEGFKRYCRKHHGTVSQYFENKDEHYNDFKSVCIEIKEEIRENQIIGGMLSFFNPSITQRLNGLKESTDVTVKEQPLFPDEKPMD